MEGSVKTKLYYFSGTGNSYVVAQELQKKLGNCELVPIPSIINEREIKIDTKKAGFVFPLYFFSTPKVIIDFVEKVDLSGVDYLFAVVTRGGKAYQGSALGDLNKMLKKKGSKLSYGTYVRMPDNYIPLLKVPDKEEQNKMFKDAVPQIQRISEAIKSDKIFKDMEYTSFLKPIVHRPFIKKLRDIDKDFYTTKECNSCGLCEKVCHFHNIKMSENKPKWQNNCQFCLACINYCPSGAIEFKKGTKGKVRYHHPNVPIKNYINI